MEARRLIQDGKCNFVCWALIDAARRVLGIDTYAMTRKKERKFLMEFFPEFFNLYDGVGWHRTRPYLKDGQPTTLVSCKMRSPHSQWWSLNMVEARLAILDFILNQ